MTVTVFRGDPHLSQASWKTHNRISDHTTLLLEQWTKIHSSMVQIQTLLWLYTPERRLVLPSEVSCRSRLRVHGRGKRRDSYLEQGVETDPRIRPTPKVPKQLARRFCVIDSHQRRRNCQHLDIGTTASATPYRGIPHLHMYRILQQPTGTPMSEADVEHHPRSARRPTSVMPI